MKVRILSLDVKLLMSLSTFLYLLQKTLLVGTLYTVPCTSNTILYHALSIINGKQPLLPTKYVPLELLRKESLCSSQKNDYQHFEMCLRK